jgi:hypothetical protein
MSIFQAPKKKPLTHEIQARATRTTQIGGNKVNFLIVSSEDAVESAGPDLSIRGEFVSYLFQFTHEHKVRYEEKGF